MRSEDRTPAPASRLPRRRPDPLQGGGLVLSQAWRPFRVSPMHDREALCQPGAASEDAHSNQREYSATFRGSWPLQRFSSHGERPYCIRPRAVPPACGSGCVLRVSHPLDALLPPRPVGLVSSRSRSWGSTLRGLALRGAVRTSRSAATLWGFRPDLSAGSAPPGFGTPPTASSTVPVIHQSSAPPDLHGLFPCEASCSPPTPGDSTWMAPHALRRSPPAGVMIDGAPGCMTAVAQPISRETDVAPLGFSTS
jgi:hypothetical protein